MSIRVLLGALVLVLVAVACQPAEEAEVGGEAEADAVEDLDNDVVAEASEPSEDVVRVAAGEDAWATGEQGPGSVHFATANVYEPLIRLGSDYSLQPGLAEDWEFIPPGTFRFHLRQGVRWHDGGALTADDVMWWGERLLEGQSLSTLGGTLGADSVEKVDDHTIDITPEQPNLRVFQQIVHPNGAIVPEGRHMDADPPIGTGPWRVAEYVPEQRLVLERFDDYWGEPAPFARMEWRFLPDPQTRIEALRAGQVDVIMDLPPDSVASVEEDPEFRVVRSPPGQMMTIFINKSGNPPHDLAAEQDIRRAISLAIDRPALVDIAFDGNAEPGRWMTPGDLLGDAADLVEPPRFDPDEARRLLEEAGWQVGGDGVRERDGRRLELEIIGWPDVSSTMFQVVQAQLGDVGVDLTIKQAPDFPTWRSYFDDAAFDLDVRIGNQNDANPSFIPVLIFSTRFAGTELFWPGEDYEDTVDDALQAETEAELQQAAAELMRTLIDEQHIVVPLAGVFRIYAMSADFDLLDPHPSQQSQDWTSLVPAG